MELGSGAHGRAGGLHGVFLLQGDGRGDVADEVYLGSLNALQKLPGVGGQRLDIAPLPLGKKGIKGEGGLPRTRDPGDHRELPPGDGAGDVLEVVGAGTDDFDVFPGHILLLKRHYSSRLRDTNILKNKGLLVNS